MWTNLAGLWCPRCGLTYADAEPTCATGMRCESCTLAPAVVIWDGFSVCINCLPKEALLDEFNDDELKREAELVTAYNSEPWCDKHEYVALRMCRHCGIGNSLEEPVFNPADYEEVEWDLSASVGDLQPDSIFKDGGNYFQVTAQEPLHVILSVAGRMKGFEAGDLVTARVSATSAPASA
jgi:hypothetical protein